MLDLDGGELIPLDWSDIDLDAGVIDINKSVEDSGNETNIKEGGKTYWSARKIYMPEILIQYLYTVKDRKGLVLKKESDGKMFTISAWRGMWESYLAELNFKYGDFSQYEEVVKGNSRYGPRKLPFVIPRITAHWLRHTFITLMYLAGVDVLTAMQQAGHSNIKTTTEIYTHLDAEYKIKEINKMNDYISGCQEGVKNEVITYG